MFKRKLRKLISHPFLFINDFFNKNIYAKRKFPPSVSFDISSNYLASTSDHIANIENFCFKLPFNDRDNHYEYLIENTHIELLVSGLTHLQNRHEVVIWIGLPNRAVTRLTRKTVGLIKSQSAAANRLIVYFEHNDKHHQLNIVKYKNDNFIATTYSNNFLHKKFYTRQITNPDRLLPVRDFDLNPQFPIDIVYTWVNGNDPKWRNLLLKHTDAKYIEWSRYMDTGELRYSLRSIFMYMNWFRKIYIVSNCEKPRYIGENDRIKWINHEEIIPDEFTPTFNSHVIESFLWHIEDLSENFIYMNDDVFVTRYLPPSMFHASNGCSISHHEPYGMVNYLQAKQGEQSLEPWEAAALRGAKLIQSKFNHFPVQLHQHAPHSLKKSVCQRMEAEFNEAFEELRRQRFRSNKDISPVSFLYHHYAFYLKEAVRGGGQSIMIRQTNYERIEKEFTRNAESYDFFCINDGGDSHKDQKFQQFKHRFMNRLFPVRFNGEID